jgi:hypothetical protein
VSVVRLADAEAVTIQAVAGAKFAEPERALGVGPQHREKHLFAAPKGLSHRGSQIDLAVFAQVKRDPAAGPERERSAQQLRYPSRMTALLRGGQTPPGPPQAAA